MCRNKYAISRLIPLENVSKLYLFVWTSQPIGHSYTGSIMFVLRQDYLFVQPMESWYDILKGIFYTKSTYPHAAPKK